MHPFWIYTGVILGIIIMCVLMDASCSCGEYEN